MSNQYLVKVAEQLKQASPLITLGKAVGSAAGRTINAVKDSAGVFAAKTPVRDTVTFMKANKKPLAIGAGAGFGAGVAVGGQEKQAKQGKEMTNKYLEKVAADHMLQGLVSPALQERAIAKDHGKKGPSAGELLSKHVGGSFRSGMRSYAEGIGGAGAGALTGAAANALASKAMGKQLAGGGRIGAVVGGLAGIAHGTYASLKNQAAEAHKKYSGQEKKAGEKWIQGAIKHPGALHKALGIPADQKIPEAKLHAAAKKGGKIGHEARLAETLKKMHHGK